LSSAPDLKRHCRWVRQVPALPNRSVYAAVGLARVTATSTASAGAAATAVPPARVIAADVGPPVAVRAYKQGSSLPMWSLWAPDSGLSQAGRGHSSPCRCSPGESPTHAFVLMPQLQQLRPRPIPSAPNILLDGNHGIERTFKVAQKPRLNYKAGGLPVAQRLFDEMLGWSIISYNIEMIFL
jgi:hypothetical protein